MLISKMLMNVSILMLAVCASISAHADGVATHKIDRKVTVACQRALNSPKSTLDDAQASQVRSCVKEYRKEVRVCAGNAGINMTSGKAIENVPAYRKCQDMAFAAIAHQQ